MNKSSVVPLGAPSPTVASHDAERHSYGQIVKSSTLIGGSTAIGICFGIIRTKVLAMLLGPGGIGLMGVYNSIIDTATVISGMGIRSSGVRQIAHSVGSGDSSKVAKTVTALRRITILLGILGAAATALLSKFICQLTFGNSQHVIAVAIVSSAIFFGAISWGLSALIQGMRRIGDLARSSVYGALFSTLVSIPIIYVFRERGIVPCVIVVAAMSALATWWFARKVQVDRITMTMADTWMEARGLFALGLIFMTSAVLTTAVAFLTRVIIVRRLGIDAAGFYQAAWTLSAIYVGFILQAMGADYFPRLSAVAKQPADCNRLINQQAEVGLLLAVPGVLATLTFAQLVIHAFYSTKFAPAAELLQWLILGMMLRVVCWPMGFLLPARSERKIFFWTQIIMNVTQFGLIWLGVKLWGLAGIGMGFSAGETFSCCMIYLVVRRMTGFSVSVSNIRHTMVAAPAICLAFVMSRFVPGTTAIVLGCCLTIAVGGYCLMSMLTALGPEKVHQYVERLRNMFIIPFKPK
jgi:PST family polysaccharide transporter